MTNPNNVIPLRPRAAPEPVTVPPQELADLADEVLASRAASDTATLCSYVLPDPAWVSADMRECGYSPADAAALVAWFKAFGFDVDPAGSPESHGEGWAYLVGEIGPAWTWKLNNPRTFESLCGDWPQVQHDYLDALMAGDVAKVRQLAPKTLIAGELRAVMDVESGCALR